MSGTGSITSGGTSTGSLTDGKITDSEKANFLRALADLIENSIGSQGNSSSGSSGSNGSSSSNNSGSPEPSIYLEDISLGWWGDPHGHGEGKVNGTNVDFKLVTKGGDGEIINWLEADKSGGDDNDISITSEFISLGRNDDNTFAGDTTIKIGDNEIAVDPGDDKDKDDAVITVNGTKISDCDLKDGYCVTSDGTKVTKDGDKIIIETADGDKVVLQDQGKYLDAKDISLADGGYDELGGILGDGLTGNLKTINNEDGSPKRTGDEVHVDANDYLAESKSSDCNTEHGADWAKEAGEFIRSLAGIIENTAVAKLLVATANLLGSNGVDNKGEVADFLTALSALTGGSDKAKLNATANAIESNDIEGITSIVESLASTS